MTDTGVKSALWQAREGLGYSREMVTRQPELDPPITAKTLERWEKDPTPLIRKRWRLAQLAAVYKLRPTDLISTGREAA